MLIDPIANMMPIHDNEHRKAKYNKIYVAQPKQTKLDIFTPVCFKITVSTPQLYDFINQLLLNIFSSGTDGINT